MKQKKYPSLRLFFTYSKRKPLLMGAYLLIAPVSALTEVALAAAMASAVDYALTGSLAKIGGYIAAYAAYAVLSLAAGYGYKRIRYRLLHSMIPMLKDDLHRQIMNMEYPAYIRQNSAEFLADLTGSMDIVRDSYFHVYLSLYPEVLKFIVAGVAMVFVSPWLGLYVLLLAVLQMVIPALCSKTLSAKGKAYADANEAYVVTAKENLESFETSKLYQIVHSLNERFSRKNWAAENARLASKSLNALVYEVSFALGNIMYLGIYVLGAFLSITGHVTLPGIIAASQFMVYIASPLTTVSSDIAELKSTIEVVDEFTRQLSGRKHADGEVRCGGFAKELALQNVRFSHGDKILLDNVDYSFQKGKKYIICGESGCGKSTLLKLLNRLISPDGGSILLDGTDICTVDLHDYARILGCVPQEPYLFDATIFENVRLFRDHSEEQVIQALQKAGLQRYLATLPEGIHTPIGENAALMSGGEKQRLAIARALAANPAILLMDEGTSHLDAATAQDIESLLFSLPDTTVILVTHNLHESTVKLADKVLHLADGRLTEESCL